MAAQHPQYDLTDQPLFGGTLRLGVPSTWRDVSEVRQVPDHQEVWQDRTEEGQPPSEIRRTGEDGRIQIEGTGGVLVVEILDRQDDVSDEGAAKFFFDDLAESTGATVSRMDYTQVVSVGHSAVAAAAAGAAASAAGSADNLMPHLNRVTQACTCVGAQLVALGKEGEVSEQPNAAGSRWAVRVEMCVLRLAEVKTDLLISLTRPIQNGAEKGIDQIAQVKNHSQLFLSIISTFSVDHWGLFVG